MDRHAYHFRSEWVVCASRERVYAVLHDVAGYPGWWPQVRSVRGIDDESGEATCRSLLPVPLHLHLTARVQDPRAGVLEVSLAGDLEGRCRWELTGPGGPDGQEGTRVCFDQVVTARSRTLRLGARAGRPLLVANHAWMMRGCRRGLAARLGVG